MSQDNKKFIKESLNKSDISKEMKVFMDSKEFENKITNIIKDRLKNNKELEDKVVEITRNVLIQLHKTLWVKRSTWVNSLSNKSS